jgi:hypothetical protein
LLGEATNSALQGLHVGRGSVSPRALAAYYYSFLHTARKFGSSTFCPIVVDAPNQQGQDPSHLEKLMLFLLTEMPEDTQVIIGAESIGPKTTANVIDVTNKKKQVLREDSYEAVSNHISPYLQQLIF